MAERNLPCSSCGYHFGHSSWCANNPKNADGAVPMTAPAQPDSAIDLRAALDGGEG